MADSVQEDPTNYSANRLLVHAHCFSYGSRIHVCVGERQSVFRQHGALALNVSIGQEAHLVGDIGRRHHAYGHSFAVEIAFIACDRLNGVQWCVRNQEARMPRFPFVRAKQVGYLVFTGTKGILRFSGSSRAYRLYVLLENAKQGLVKNER